MNDCILLSSQHSRLAVNLRSSRETYFNCTLFDRIKTKYFTRVTDLFTFCKPRHRRRLRVMCMSVCVGHIAEERAVRAAD